MIPSTNPNSLRSEAVERPAEDPLEIIAGLDQAIDLLMTRANRVNCAQLKRKLRSAYGYLEGILNEEVQSILNGGAL